MKTSKRDRNLFKILHSEKYHSSNQIPCHRVPRQLVSVLYETQPLALFSFFFFFFIDIIAKCVARTFQAAIQLALDMCTPCRVSLAHLSPCNTLRYNAGGKCVSFDWSFVPFATLAFHFPRNDSTRIDTILSVIAISWIFYETFVCSCNIKKMSGVKNEICPNSLESYF